MSPWPRLAYRCICGTTVWHEPTANGRDWMAVDENGSSIQQRNAVAGLANVPQDKSLGTWLIELRALVGTPEGKHWAGVYSQLTASLALGQYSTYHLHSTVGELIDERPDRDPPYCHNSPMWHHPTGGWACRKVGTAFPAIKIA